MILDKLIQEVIEEADKERAEYHVQPGEIVYLTTDGEQVVSHIIMKGDVEKALSDKTIWGLFVLVGVDTGATYAAPVPVMTEGTVDLRRLMGSTKVVYRETENGVRYYDAKKSDGYELTVTVRKKL